MCTATSYCRPAACSQVGAHGTGARIPPFDEQVVGLRLVTPGLGALNLSNEEEPELFRWEGLHVY